jgi:demethylmenaquinone methyltransferase/2-methoxy-6-polyprenyl-1,4-benzoquinol methylase
MTTPEKTTHFGFESVDWDTKEQKVAEVFHSVAKHYDRMNDLMSFGIHRLWKAYAALHTNLRPGQSVLDIAGGSGDVSRLLSQQVGETGEVILADINAAMLQVGRDRLLDEGIYKNLHCVQANAEALPFKDNSFHCITMAFGLRNVTDKDAALRSMYRVCKPGGKLLILEFSKPVFKGLSTLYDWYSFNVLPKMGGLIAKDEASYRYLAESIRMHPAQEALQEQIHESGFEDCSYQNLNGGIVALHLAYKY